MIKAREIKEFCSEIVSHDLDETLGVGSSLPFEDQRDSATRAYAICRSLLSSDLESLELPDNFQPYSNLENEVRNHLRNLQNAFSNVREFDRRQENAGAKRDQLAGPPATIDAAGEEPRASGSSARVVNIDE